MCGCWEDKCEDIDVEQYRSQSNQDIQVRTRKTNQPAQKKCMHLFLQLFKVSFHLLSLSEGEIENNADYCKQDPTNCQNEVDYDQGWMNSHHPHNGDAIIRNAICKSELMLS